jgi:hypothetical protein
LNHQGVTQLLDSSSQYRVDRQLASELFDVDFFALVLKRGGPRDHLKLRYFGKAVDQIFGDSVGEVIHVRIGGDVNEWQHDERFNAWLHPEARIQKSTGARYRQGTSHHDPPSLVRLQRKSGGALRDAADLGAA